MSNGIFERLGRAARDRGTLLCVGLDPRIDPEESFPQKSIVETNRRLIEATAEFALAYKPNIAFYERHGSAGIDALIRSIELVPDGVFTILDAKRGDVGSTAESYAAAAFETFGADIVTVSPYLGRESVAPFLAYSDRGVFVLCRTSNPSAADIQDLRLAGTEALLFEKLAEQILAWGENLGLVVAGNDVEALQTLRTRFPSAWFLAPGIGAQGGSMREAVIAGVRKEGATAGGESNPTEGFAGILPVVARAIANADDPGEAARQFRDEIREAATNIAGPGAPPTDRAASAAPLLRSPRTFELASAGPGSDGPNDSRPSTMTGTMKGGLRDRVISGLFELDCFQVGAFTLKSGQESPFYVDLRRAVASAAFMRTLASAYAQLSEGLAYDRLAGIPVAALPIATALSLQIDRPLIYPRIPPKPHGSGRPVEGAFAPGERVLLVDDLITTGESKTEAVRVLESEGLHVEHLVVLLERGRTGRRDMEDLGIELHAFLRIEEVLHRGRELGFISDADAKRIFAYLKR